MNRVLCAVVALAFFVAPACGAPKTVKKPTEDELKAKRDSAQQSYSIGQGYFSQGDLDAALRNFNEAVQRDSTFYEAHVAIGAVYRRQRNAGDAEVWFRSAIRVDPKKPKAYEGLGDLFLSRASEYSAMVYQESVKICQFKQHGEEDSVENHESIRANLATLHVGMLDSALAVYTQGLAQDSSLVDLYVGKAEVHVRKGEWAEAEATYQRAMRLFPDDPNVQRLWADFLFKQKRFNDAVQALLPVVSKFPKVATLRQRLADSYIELKRYAEASAQLDTILQDDPSDNQTMLRRGAVLMLQEKYTQATQVFQELIGRDSTRAEYYDYLAQAHIQRGNTARAEQALATALKRDPKYAPAFFHYGEIRMRSADQKRGKNLTATSTANLREAKRLYEEARGFYQRALSNEDFAPDARSRIQYVDEALQAVEKELFVR